MRNISCKKLFNYLTLRTLPTLKVKLYYANSSTTSIIFLINLNPRNEVSFKHNTMRVFAYSICLTKLYLEDLQSTTKCFVTHRNRFCEQVGELL